MNIAPVNNNNRLHFKKVYCAQVSYNVLPKDLEPLEAMGEFSFILNRVFEEIEKERIAKIIKESKKYGFLGKLKRASQLYSELDYRLIFESVKFTDFRLLKELAGDKSRWFRNHLESLDISIPKPKTDKGHTFFIYTGNDRSEVDMLSTTLAKRRLRDKPGDIDFKRRFSDSDIADNVIQWINEKAGVKNITLEDESGIDRFYREIYSSMFDKD